MSRASATVFATTVPRAKVQVGVNYPWAWNKSGLYFGGGGPPRSNATMMGWVNTLKPNLDRIQAAGVNLVRIFLLCNMSNLGEAKGPGTGSSWEWTFSPPSRPLDTIFVEHLEAMLTAFRDRQMQVIPSLVDFKAICSAQNPEARDETKGSGLRYEIVTGRGVDFSAQSWFMDEIVKPFLAKSVTFKQTIFAWEVMNEPIWALWFNPMSPYNDKSVGRDLLTIFLNRVLGEIEGRGFQSTVGHRFIHNLGEFLDPGLPTGTKKQFHHYPYAFSGRFLAGLDGKLPKCPEGAFLGEFGAGPPQDSKHDWWPEIANESTLATRKRVFERLKVIEQQAYPTALIWPDLPGDAIESATDTLKLSPDALQGIVDYLKS